MSIADMRGLWMDLARQPEHLPVIFEYFEAGKAAGFNTVFLYLEDRVKTSNYPYLPESESYSAEQIREIVAYADRLGLELIPVLEPLGHIGRFLKHPELQHFSELREEGVLGRYGGGGPGGVACPLHEGTYEFFDQYIREVAELFPSERFMLCYDEIWDMGYCSDCVAFKKEHGETELFRRNVLHNYELLGDLGKTLIMADDMTEHYPDLLDSLPRDVIILTWQYTYLNRVAEGHFNTTARFDPVKTYGEMGFKTIMLSYDSLQNIESVTQYLRTARPLGVVMSTWELQLRQSARNLPILAYAGAVWAQDKPVSTETMIEAVATVAGSREAAEVLVAVDGLIGEIPCEGSPLPLPPKSGRFNLPIRRELKQDMAAVLLTSRLREVEMPERLRNIYLSRVLVYRASYTLRKLNYELLRHRTGEVPLDKEGFRTRIAECREFITEYIALDKALWEQDRNGLEMTTLAKYHASLSDCLERLAAEGETAGEGEIGRLDVHFFLPDPTAAPKMKITVHYDDEDVVVAHQIMKSIYLHSDPHYDIVFDIDGKRKPKAVTFSWSGYGGVGLAYADVTMPNRGRLTPVGIARVEGLVEHPEFMLVDDSRATMFGEQDMLLAMKQHAHINDGTASVTLTLG